MVDPRTAVLARELHVLHDLTVQESLVARIRRLQARDAGTKAEFADNAADATDRAGALKDALSALGTPPDVAAPVVGAALALLRAQLDALRSPSGALLGDLAMENSLLAHARFVRQLAEGLDLDDIVALSERLEASHAETLSWVEERLAEVASGTKPVVRPLPPQLAVAAVQSAAMTPVLLAGRFLARVRPGVRAAGERAGQVAGAVASVGSSVGTGISSRAGRSTGQAPVGDGDMSVDDEIALDDEQVVDLTAVEAPAEHDLPIKEYHRLSGDTVMRHVDDMTDPVELAQVLAFEQAHKARPGVVDALQGRIDKLASASA